LVEEAEAGLRHSAAEGCLQLVGAVSGGTDCLRVSVHVPHVAG
jgi:hypothetical protein